MEIHYNTNMDINSSDTPTPEGPRDPAPVPRPIPPEPVIVISPPPEDIWLDEPRPVVYRRPRTRLALILFLLTCLSTFFAGVVAFPVPGNLLGCLLRGLE